MNKQFSVFISMAGERDVGLNQVDQLLFRHGLERLCMGKMTQEDIDDLCGHLQRLKVHLESRPKPQLKPGDPGFTWPACEQCGSTSLRCGCD